MFPTQKEKPSTSAEEDGIKFRPSENFKHMKKYLKWKFENSNLNASPNDLPESTTPISNTCKEENLNPPIVVQPPLPPYSPPAGVYIKQEIDNEDYQDREPEALSDFRQPEANSDISTTTKPKEIMCRDFIRGTCKFGSTCKYVHAIIKEQLNNVYRFCKEFQNKGCFLPTCKFVHCTIFEQENFYRTAELPPHVIDEFKHRHQLSLPLQQTLPPKETFEVSAQVVPHVYVNATTFETSTNGANENRPDMYQYVPDCSTASNKRKFCETYDSTYSPCDLDFRVPPPKICKDCDSSAFRFNFFKNKVKEMIFDSDDYKLQIAQLNKKTQRLMALLECVGHPMFQNMLGNIHF